MVNKLKRNVVKTWGKEQKKARSNLGLVEERVIRIHDMKSKVLSFQDLHVDLKDSSVKQLSGDLVILKAYPWTLGPLPKLGRSWSRSWG